jgi:arginine/lysine/ornithine decarboxylase
MLTNIQELKDQFKAGKLQRRHIRNKLFRIRDNRSEDIEDIDNLKEYIEAQFDVNQKWEGFTFDWDVGVHDPFKVITIDEWVKNGGKFDEMGRRTPPAFTNQK